MRRVAPITTSLLLAGSAVLIVAGAWERWATACPIGRDWNAGACLAQQSHEHDVLIPSTTEWVGNHQAALLAALGYVLLGCALLLLPAALTMGARPWQWAVVAVTAPSVVAIGIATAQSGRLGRIVETPGLPLFVSAMALPAALFLLVWRPHADSPPLGPRRATVVWLLVLTTPLLQLLVVSRLLILYGSYDTSPWTEAAIVPLLLAAAVLLRPWRVAAAPQRSFSNQQRAHAFSL